MADKTKAHNRTVQQMSDTDPSTITVYEFTKEQADKLMRKLGHQGENEAFLNGDVGNKLQDGGGLHGKLARHAQKWLTQEGSTTTIPLTKDEHKQVAEMGVKLSKV